MKRAALLIACHFALAGLGAQSALTEITISTSDPRVRFWVDGALYRGAATFRWEPNSRHVLYWESAQDGYQYDPFGRVRYALTGWEDSSGKFTFGPGPTQFLYASPEITWIRMNVSVEYEVVLRFWEPPAGQAAYLHCTPLAIDQPLEFGPGVVFINGVCYRGGGRLWLPADTYVLEARPLPGFVFAGWTINGTNPDSYLVTVPLGTPSLWQARFDGGKRIRFLTEPLGFQLLLDQSPVATPPQLPCLWKQNPLAVPSPNIGWLCSGEVDWALGSKHTIGAVEVQNDAYGREWVFDRFSNGMENNSVYEVTSLEPETIIARFVPGARVALLTDPPGLKLIVNGRDDLPPYFIAKPGDTLTISAPATQIGPNGRRYAFRAWSNGGEAAQQVTVPEEAVDNGLRLTARYEMLSRVTIDGEPAGVPVDVDGVACPVPCHIDRDEGAEVAVAAPEAYEVSPGRRLEFASWSDGAPRVRTLKVAPGEPARLTVRFNSSYLLQASSDPPGAAAFLLEPASPDGFYPEGASVQITATVNRGYRFRHWAGDLSGTALTGWIAMHAPRAVTALLDPVPFLQPDAIRNAAGPTPSQAVAAGSIISILGGMLAPRLEIGPDNPLLQTLAGVAVRVDDRILALLFVSPEQINAVLPPDLPEGPHRIVITRPTQPDMEGEFSTVRNAPGLFTHPAGPDPFVMASHLDGSPVTLEKPARRGELIRIFGTGFGPYDKVPPYGFALPPSPEFRLADPVEVLLGDRPLQPDWAGGAPGLSGTDLLRLRVPQELEAPATVELKVRINAQESNTVLLPIE